MFAYWRKRRELVNLAKRQKSDLAAEIEDLENVARAVHYTKEFFIGVCASWDRTNVKASRHLKRVIPSFLTKAWRSLRDSRKKLKNAKEAISSAAMGVNRLMAVNLLFSDISKEEWEEIKSLVEVANFNKEITALLEEIIEKAWKLMAEVRLLRKIIRTSSVSELIEKREKILAIIKMIEEHTKELRDLTNTQFRAIFAEKSAHYSLLAHGNTSGLLDEFSLYDEERKIRKKGILFFHMTNYFPDKGVIWPAMMATGQMRDTVHFTVNGPVGGHLEGSWEGQKYCVVIPFTAFPVRRLVSFVGYDTYVHGAVKLKHAIIVAKERELREELAEKGKTVGEVVEALKKRDIHIVFVEKSVYQYAEHLARKMFRTSLAFGGTQTYLSRSSIEVTGADKEFASRLGVLSGPHAFHPAGSVEDATKQVISVGYALKQRDSYTRDGVFFALHRCHLSPNYVLKTAEEYCQDPKMRRAVANLLSQYEKAVGWFVEQLELFVEKFDEVQRRHKKQATLSDGDCLLFAFSYDRFSTDLYHNPSPLETDYPNILQQWPKASRYCIAKSERVLKFYKQIVAIEDAFTLTAKEVRKVRVVLERAGVQLI